MKGPFTGKAGGSPSGASFADGSLKGSSVEMSGSGISDMDHRICRYLSHGKAPIGPKCSSVDEWAGAPKS
jgi:hypothetical protein